MQVLACTTHWGVGRLLDLEYISSLWPLTQRKAPSPGLDLRR